MNKKNNADIVFNNVSKTYFLCANDLQRLLLIIAPWIKRNTKQAITNISFTINRGEKVAFVGINGAGKSTILKIISGATIHSSGKFKIKRRVSCILDVGSGLEPDFSGIENIYIRGALLGYSRKEIKTHVEEIVEFCGIDEYIGQELKRYSAGMIAKLSVSIALHLKPEILVVDEALSVGDIGFNNMFKNKVIELSRKSDLTLLLISHNEETILDLCTRIILIHDSIVMYDGPTKAGLQKYHEILGVKTHVEKTISKHKRKPKSK